MKKQILSKVLSPQLFALCYLPFLAINMVQVINPLAVTRVLLALYAVWGLAVALNSYLFSKDIWTGKYLPVLLVFLAVCLITELLNFSFGGVRVVGELCYFALCIVVLYTQHRSDVNGYSALLKKLSCVLGIVISVMMLASLWMYANMYTLEITNRAGDTKVIGFHSNRLFGVFSSPNVGGLFALILIWCSLASLYLRKGDKQYGVWIAVSVIQIILAAGFLSVALSRGSNLVGIGFVVVFMILRPATTLELKQKLWQQYGIRIATAILAVAVCVGAVSVMNKLLLGMMKVNFAHKYAVDLDKVGDIDPSDPNLTEDEKNAAAILGNAMLGFDGRVEAGRDDIDITNKRMDIWKAHLSILSGKQLLTGVNDPYVWYQKMIEQGIEFTKQQETFIKWASGNMHNGFLQILVNCGIFALLAMLAFLVICFVKCILYFVRSMKMGKCNNLQYTIFGLTLPMVLCILANNIVETNFVLMGANFFQALFWFAAGAAVLCAMDKQEEVK